MKIEKTGPFRYFFLGVVLMPNKAYSGQKLIRLVTTNMTARIKNMMPRVPLSKSVNSSTTITAAKNNRIVLSVFPMFFFIILGFWFMIVTENSDYR